MEEQIYTSQTAAKYLNYLAKAHKNGEKILHDEVIAGIGIWCFGKNNYDILNKKILHKKQVSIKENDTQVSKDDLASIKESLEILQPIVSSSEKTGKIKIPSYAQTYYIPFKNISNQMIKSAENNANIQSSIVSRYIFFLYNTVQSCRPISKIEEDRLNQTESIFDKIFHKEHVPFEEIEDTFFPSENNFSFTIKPEREFYNRDNNHLSHTSPAVLYNQITDYVPSFQDSMKRHLLDNPNESKEQTIENEINDQNFTTQQ